jgi:hypothetical protein
MIFRRLQLPLNIKSNSTCRVALGRFEKGGRHGVTLPTRVAIMNAITRVAISSVASVCVLGSATAADLTGAELNHLLSGRSVYLQTTLASATGAAGQGVIYYAADGKAVYKTPTGVLWHGTWAIKGNTVCFDWKEKRNNPCSKYEKRGDSISIIGVTTGEVRAKIVGIGAGNAENLAP